MERVITELYMKMNEGDYRNREFSDYWIYDVDSIIKRIDGLSRRFIKVSFFNRYFNEKENLMRLHLMVNGEKVTQDKFSKEGGYNNASIMGFVVEVDLEEERKEVEILSYIKDGKKVTELGEYIDHFDEDLDKEKLNLLRLYKYPDESQELNMVPQVKENYWLCKCGHYNSLKSRAVRFCPICGTRIEEAREMEQVDNKTLILENINTVIKISPGETREEVIERYVEAFHKKYGFDRDEVRKSIDPEKIKINDQANTVSSTVESAPQSTSIATESRAASDKKWIIIAGVALGVIIFFLLLSSLSETNQKERCYDRGGLWINGACEMFDEGFY